MNNFNGYLKLNKVDYYFYLLTIVFNRDLHKQWSCFILFTRCVLACKTKYGAA